MTSPSGGWLTRRALLAALIAFITSVPGIASAARDPEKGWYKLVTPNFEMFSDARESEARRLLRELETFRHVVSRFLGLTNVQRHPAMVFYFADDDLFRPYKPRYEGQPRGVSGFHVEDPLDYALALSRQAKGSATMRVLFHEYTHLLTARQFRHAPLWALEGVAEVFSTFEGRDDRFDIGVAATNHVFFLQKAAPLTVEDLFRIGLDSREYNERDRAGRFYASSWLLTHHLLFGRRGFETNALARFAALCATTTNQVDAFRRTFQSSPADTDRQLRQYLLGGNYTVVRQTYADLETARPTRKSLELGELSYAFGRLLQLAQQHEKAKVRLERAAGLAPQDPRPPAALALLAWRLRDREGLRRHADQAIGLGSREAFIHFLAAEVRFQELNRNRAPAIRRSEALAEGRRLCERALELDPELAPAHHLLGVYVLAERPEAPGLAVVHIQAALRCDPQYKPGQLTWASLLAAQGDFTGARRILANLLAGPLPEELREAARQVAADVEKHSRSREPAR